MASGFVAGVDLGASNLRIVIANSDGEIEARRSGPLPAGAPEAVLAAIDRTIHELVRGVWVGARVDAIGVALPGAIDPATGTVESIANMPGWDRIPLVKILSEAKGVPVAIENDANAAAIGEGWIGVARGLRDYIFIALGTGVGSGIVLDGRLHRGTHFLAGEVAFLRMTREQLQTGGWEQCLEGQIGGRAAARTAVQLLGAHAKTVELFAAARANEADAIAWLAEMQDYIAMAVVGIAALLDPQAIVFGGGVAVAQGEWFLSPIRERALRCVPGEPNILLSALGEDAQVIGAAKLALDKLMEA